MDSENYSKTKVERSYIMARIVKDAGLTIEEFKQLL